MSGGFTGPGLPIRSITPTPAVVIVTPNHGLTNGQEIWLAGVPGVEGNYVALVIDQDQIAVIGARLQGPYNGAGHVLSARAN